MSDEEKDLQNIDFKKEEYKQEYSDKKLTTKLISVGKTAGKELLYKVAQLYILLKKDYVPVPIKVAIVSALGYFICPIDVVPDTLPGIGYTDDLVVIGQGLLLAQIYITEEVREEARQVLRKLFGDNFI